MQGMLPECGYYRKKQTEEVAIAMENRRKKPQQNKEEHINLF